MPLLNRKPVPLIPIPDTTKLAPDSQVFFLKSTGEIFLDYDDYANRLSYLLCRIFQCESSGRLSLDYFAALESEKAESRIVRERFPDQLKGRVLATVQFQVVGRLDALVDAVYERYKGRYFRGENVFIDLAGERYFARISKVFPPSSLRSTREEVHEGSTQDELEAWYDRVAHTIGTDLNLKPEEAERQDPQDEYLYTVQLRDKRGKFEGSFMEVKGEKLSRERLAFSKSMLKRYMKECIERDPLIASPWMVKPLLAKRFGITQEQTEEEEKRNREMREGALSKRRKIKEGEDGTLPPLKKPRRSIKVEQQAIGPDGLPIPSDPSSSRAGTPAPRVPAEPKKPIKYPIEDLDLDPMSIHDGRILRRVNAELPPLPPKPAPSKELLVEPRLFDQFVMVWNALNVFSRPLVLSTFSLDDFAGALRHSTRDPRCLLLAEIHACLTNIISTDPSRVLGVSTAFGYTVETHDVTEEEVEFDKLVRRGISFSKRWDRAAKLKTQDGREGWERHTLGALCQRGGPQALPNLHRILKHLFPPAVDGDEPLSAPAMKKETSRRSSRGTTEPTAEEVAQRVAATNPEDEEEIDELDLPNSEIADEEDDGAVEDTGPMERYLTLELEDKLEILNYLVTLVLGSKVVRSYIDDSETQLTEFRKQRADVNKERRALLEQKSVLEGKPIKTEGANGASGAAGEDGANGNGTNSATGTPALGAPDTPNPDGSPSETGSNEDEKPTGLPTNGNDSEVDELEEEEEEDGSVDDSMSVSASDSGGPSGAAGSRRVALEEKRLERQAMEQARTAELVKIRDEAKLRNASKKEADRLRNELEDLLAKNAKKDDHVEREFRRYQGVARVRPLGKDRFFNRYWWLDGIGGMNLIGPGNGILYGTGRLLVQGPSKEDWELACGRNGEQEMVDRRLREEVDPESILQVDEWAFYEEEEEVDALQGWLNAKGLRENALKNALQKWRMYILPGSRRRQNDTAKPFQAAAQIADGRRTKKGREPESAKSLYMAYHNKLAKL